MQPSEVVCTFSGIPGGAHARLGSDGLLGGDDGRGASAVAYTVAVWHCQVGIATSHAVWRFGGVKYEYESVPGCLRRARRAQCNAKRQERGQDSLTGIEQAESEQTRCDASCKEALVLRTEHGYTRALYCCISCFVRASLGVWQEFGRASLGARLLHARCRRRYWHCTRTGDLPQATTHDDVGVRAPSPRMKTDGPQRTGDRQPLLRLGAGGRPQRGMGALGCSACPAPVAPVGRRDQIRRGGLDQG